MSEDDVPDNLKDFIKLNAELSKKWPIINEMKDAMADAEQWKAVKGKIQHLEQ